MASSPWPPIAFVPAHMKLAQGQSPGIPVRNDHHALHGYIRTCGSGKAKDFYDYSCTDPGLIPEEAPDQFNSLMVLGSLALFSALHA